MSLNINNTLAGRMLIGPAKNLLFFYWQDSKAIVRRDECVLGAYLIHAVGVAGWLWWIIAYSSVPLWQYAIAAYLAVSLLNVRTFLEHRAHQDVPGRIVVIEDRGIFAFLFLNNNLHLVHHCHPMAPWYRLPALYQAKRDAYLQQNGHYVYPNYRAVFAQYLFNRKDPVAHPLLNLHSTKGDVDLAIVVAPLHVRKPA